MRYLIFLPFIFIFLCCKRPCTDPPENNVIDEKYFAWLPDSAKKFSMISDKGIEMQFTLDTPINNKPRDNSNLANCPELHTQSMSRIYYTTYMGEVHYGISSGLGDDKLKGNNLMITGGNFLSILYFDNPEANNEIGSEKRTVKCSFTFLPEFTVRNKKYSDVYKIWMRELEQVTPEYVDTIYTAKNYGLLYFTQRNGAFWARK